VAQISCLPSRLINFQRSIRRVVVKRTARKCTGEMEGQPDHERRLQRLQEILDELMALTDWKKT